MHTKPGLLIACGLVGLVISGTGRVMALSCALPELLAPAPDAVDVPTNTRVWCSSNPAGGSLVVTDGDGDVVTGTHTRMSSPDYEVVVFRPDSELSPNSEYQVDCPRGYDDQRTFSFTTGASVRSTPPAIPNVSMLELSAEQGDWGDSYQAHFPQVAELGSIVVLDFGGSSTLAPSMPSGYVADAFFLRYSEDFWVGTGPCAGNWPGAALGATTTVAIGAFDLTGAFSGWSDTIKVTLPASFDSEDVSRPDDVALPDAPDVVDVPEQPSTMAGDVMAPDVVAREASQSTSTRRPPVARPKEIPPLQGRATCQFGVLGASPSGAAGLLTVLLCVVARRARRSTAAD